MKELGAAAAFDYRSNDVEDQVVKWLDGKTVAGAYHAVGEGGAQAAARIVDRSKGKAIVVTVRGVPEKGVPGSVRMKASKSFFGSSCWVCADWVIVGSTAIFSNDVGPKIWREFLPKALKNGTIVPKPDPKIVGENLRSVQLGLDTQKKGVSAEKVVVSYIN